MAAIELNAMKEIFDILEPLAPEARKRVLAWVTTHLDIKGVVEEEEKREEEEHKHKNNDSFQTFADLYNAASPETQGDKALVAGFWFQQCQGHSEFPSHVVNKELQNLGHVVPNITDAFDQLKKKKPALAIQVKKSGKTKQARKQYKLTQAGIDAVSSMLSKDSAD